MPDALSDAFNGRNRRPKRSLLAFLPIIVTGLLLVLTQTMSSGRDARTAASLSDAAEPMPAAWEEKAAAIRWVAYSPPLADPDRNIPASEQAIREDIELLHQAGFTGLVTYSSSGTMGQYLPALAQSAGFEGVIVGVWSPMDEGEMAQAEAAAQLPVVLGVCVGNEGLHERYEMAELSSAIERIRQSTGKPVTTAEQIDDYSDEALLQLGDWVFPNAHPYFHGQLEPAAAAQWTQTAYDDLASRAGRFVLFKEVGLPTSGDPGEPLSEENQARYYQELANTGVRFVYFEAYDQPWKTHLPLEPHWGIFRSDRTPKLFAASLLGAASNALG
jgi:exo-beta-1,3-glucanase (GH17 family)